MTKTLLDTSILIKLLNSSEESLKQEELLGKLNQEGGLFINPVIYSELSVYFDEKEILDNFLEETGIKVEKIKERSCFEAGKKFSNYNEERGKTLQCPECGDENLIKCEGCRSILSFRQHITPDFLIGSHAKNQADRLATLDKDFHKRYFEDLEIVE